MIVTVQGKLVAIKVFPVSPQLIINNHMRRVFKEFVEDSGILGDIFDHNSVDFAIVSIVHFLATVVEITDWHTVVKHLHTSTWFVGMLKLPKTKKRLLPLTGESLWVLCFKKSDIMS